MALGWFTGMLLHATWNGTAVLSGGDEELFYTFYMFIHIPLFLLWFLFIALAMKRERRDAAQAHALRAQGWIIPAEIQMVCDPRSRRAALAGVQRWAVGEEGNEAVHVRARHTRPAPGCHEESWSREGAHHRIERARERSNLTTQDLHEAHTYATILTCRFMPFHRLLTGTAQYERP